MNFLISNFTETLFFASWTGLAAFQMASATVGGWKWLKNWRRPVTDYEQVINGETRRGWHVAIPRNKLLKYYNSTVCKTNHHLTGYYRPFDLWTDDLDHQTDVLTPPSTSFVFWFEDSLPNGKAVHQIRRISFVQPCASETLLKVICDPKKWNCHDSRYLTSRNLMVTFRRHDGSQYRIFLMDAFRKCHQALAIMPPERHRYLSFAYLEKTSTKLQLRLVWAKFTRTPNEIGNRMEFTDAAYDLPEGNSATPLNPSSTESISFPVGIHHFCHTFWSGIPITAVPFNNSPDQDQNPDNIQCLTFDNSKKWKRESLTHWLAEFGKSETGKRIRTAAQSFLQLSLPDHWKWININALKEFQRIFTVPRSDALFALTSGGGILKRWIRPPSLLRTAAEHLFRANPELKISVVKEATGVDLSDGIEEDKEECDILTL